MIALVWAVLAAAAEPVVPLAPDARVAVSLSSGFADAVAPLDLAGAVRLPVGARPVTLHAALTVPLLQLDLADHAVEVGAAVPLRDRPWDARVGGALREVSTANDAFAATALGTSLSVRPGYYDDRWTLGLEASLWTAWATRIATTPWARDLGGATDYHRWSAWTATVGRVGVVGGGLIGPVGLGLRAGYESRGELNLVIPPFYVLADVDVRF